MLALLWYHSLSVSAAGAAWVGDKKTLLSAILFLAVLQLIMLADTDDTLKRLPKNTYTLSQPPTSSLF